MTALNTTDGVLRARVWKEITNTFENVSWKCVNFTSTILTIQIHFTKPESISNQLPKDLIELTFYSPKLFRS